MRGLFVRVAAFFLLGSATVFGGPPDNCIGAVNTHLALKGISPITNFGNAEGAPKLVGDSKHSYGKSQGTDLTMSHDPGSSTWHYSNSNVGTEVKVIAGRNHVEGFEFSGLEDFGSGTPEPYTISARISSDCSVTEIHFKGKDDKDSFDINSTNSFCNEFVPRFKLQNYCGDKENHAFRNSGFNSPRSSNTNDQFSNVFHAIALCGEFGLLKTKAYSGDGKVPASHLPTKNKRDPAAQRGLNSPSK